MMPERTEGREEARRGARLDDSPDILLLFYERVLWCHGFGLVGAVGVDL